MRKLILCFALCPMLLACERSKTAVPQQQGLDSNQTASATLSTSAKKNAPPLLTKIRSSRPYKSFKDLVKDAAEVSTNSQAIEVCKEEDSDAKTAAFMEKYALGMASCAAVKGHYEQGEVIFFTVMIAPNAYMNEVWLVAMDNTAEESLDVLALSFGEMGSEAKSTAVDEQKINISIYEVMETENGTTKKKKMDLPYRFDPKTRKFEALHNKKNLEGLLDPKR